MPFTPRDREALRAFAARVGQNVAADTLGLSRRYLRELISGKKQGGEKADAALRYLRREQESARPAERPKRGRHRKPKPERPAPEKPQKTGPVTLQEAAATEQLELMREAIGRHGEINWTQLARRLNLSRGQLYRLRTGKVSPERTAELLRRASEQTFAYNAPPYAWGAPAMAGEPNRYYRYYALLISGQAIYGEGERDGRPDATRSILVIVGLFTPEDVIRDTPAWREALDRIQAIADENDAFIVGVFHHQLPERTL